MVIIQTPIYTNVGRSSSTSSLDRRTLKTASCESDRCLALRKSARHSVSQTHLYSTHNTTTNKSVAGQRIWANGTYSGPVNKQGYSCGSKIFRAMDAIKAKEKELATKAIAKIKVVSCIYDPNV